MVPSMTWATDHRPLTTGAAAVVVVVVVVRGVWVVVVARVVGVGPLGAAVVVVGDCVREVVGGETEVVVAG